MEISECRGCASTALVVFAALGDRPLAGRFLADTAAIAGERRYPLDLARCDACGLVQIIETVPRAELFPPDYFYFSSFSRSLLDDARPRADALIAERRLGAGSLVIEIGCNDGYLLRSFRQRGIAVAGVEPAAAPCSAARAQGIPVTQAFFDRDVAQAIGSAFGPADLVLANNVVAHVENLHDFLDGVRALLKPDGVAIIEVHYAKALFEGNQFDTVYHEHLCYFSAGSLRQVLERHALYVSDIALIASQGGSLRVTVSAEPRPCAALERMLAAETGAGMGDAAYYADFAGRVESLCRALSALVVSLKEAGNRIAGYGAAAKGVMLLEACGIRRDLLDFVVDANTRKQGRLMPGTHIDIRAPGAIREAAPDYLLLLPWNLREEILGLETDFRARGGRFIIPIPEPDIV